MNKQVKIVFHIFYEACTLLTRFKMEREDGKLWNNCFEIKMLVTFCICICGLKIFLCFVSSTFHRFDHFISTIFLAPSLSIINQENTIANTSTYNLTSFFQFQIPKINGPNKIWWESKKFLHSQCRRSNICNNMLSHIVEAYSHAIDFHLAAYFSQAFCNILQIDRLIDSIMKVHKNSIQIIFTSHQSITIPILCFLGMKSFPIWKMDQTRALSIIVSLHWNY